MFTYSKEFKLKVIKYCIEKTSQMCNRVSSFISSHKSNY